MKKITIISALVSAVALVLSGCSKDGGAEDDRHYPMANNYVWNYVRPTKIFLPDDLSTYNKGNGAYRQYVFFVPLGDELYNDGEVWTREMKDKFHDENLIHDVIYSPDYIANENPVIGDIKRRYDSLCVAHKDTEYKKEKRYCSEVFPYATYRRMTLDITSDTQYDAAHPAGTSLADMVIINISSAKEIIESGYDENLCGKEINIYGDEYPVLSSGYELRMPLKQFNEEYRKLVDCRMNIDFPVAPDVTSTHRFTVTYRDEDGRVLTATAAPVTLQGKGAE